MTTMLAEPMTQATMTYQVKQKRVHFGNRNGTPGTWETWGEPIGNERSRWREDNRYGEIDFTRCVKMGRTEDETKAIMARVKTEGGEIWWDPTSGIRYTPTAPIAVNTNEDEMIQIVEPAANDTTDEATAGLQVAPSQFDPARHDGKITLVSPRTGEHRTFRIRTVRRGPLAGSRVVEILSGPDNESSYSGFAFISDGRASNAYPSGTVTVWKRYRGDEGGKPSLHEQYADLLNRMAYWGGRGVEYLISLQCRRCGRDLTHPESIADGLGPICRERLDS